MIPRARTAAIILAVCCAVGLLAASARQLRGEAKVREWSQQELQLAISASQSPFILDVRTPEEFESGHVPGAVNVPHTEVGARMKELSAHRGVEMVLYCERGGRAARAIAELDGAGFEHLGHLAGDMSAWRGAGLPVEPR